jgi:hypothetical protein
VVQLTLVVQDAGEAFEAVGGEIVLGAQVGLADGNGAFE